MPTNTPNIRAIFDRALEIESEAGRRAYLDEVCAAAPDIRQQVEALLAAHAAAGSFLETPPSAIAVEAGPTIDQPLERPGTQIGPYKLLQEIGQGGMGVVYMAEQKVPVERRVALKIIKPGMDSRQVIARFEAERQALALMDHPNIAKVFDAGTTESGRPYFVMELVKGQPITQYCDEKHLTPRQRLELLLPVCQAIQHAHQKGIIHRDIKPSNILVAEYDEQPVPKVIDFGVAKAIGSPLTEKTMFTGFGQLVGTLEYMSPEQAKVNQLDIDTRSDIYSLGVLLYELLTGSTPFDKQRLRSAAFDEMLRIIREEEPPKPSTRLSEGSRQAPRAVAPSHNAATPSDGTRSVPATLASIAAVRGTEPARLSKLVRGELDWIVMKALEKDRNRRYETANGLAMDIQRYLADEPVVACPPSATYRLRKFARRNKGALAAGAVLGMALLVAVGAVAGSVGWVARDRAAQQLLTEQAVEQALKQSDEHLEKGKWPQALETARRAEAALASGSGSEHLRQRVAERLADLQMLARLEDIRLGNPHAFGDDPSSIDRANAELFRAYGIDVTALQPGEAAERIRSRAISVELAAALDQWALWKPDADEHSRKRLRAIALAADPDEWRTRVRAAAERRDTNLLLELAASPRAAELPPVTVMRLANALEKLDRRADAVALLRRAQAKYRDDFQINHRLGLLLTTIEPPDWNDAIRFYQAALVVRPKHAGVLHNLGRALEDKGRLDEAIEAFRESIRIENWSGSHNSLGTALAKKGLPDEAIACYRQAIQLNPRDALAHHNLGIILRKKGLLDEAVAAFKEAVGLDPSRAVAHLDLGVALCDKGLLEEAIAAYKEAIRLKPDHAMAHNQLGIALRKKGLPNEAIAAFNEAIRLKPDEAMAHNNLGNALADNRLLDAAIAAFRKAIALKPDEYAFHTNLGMALTKKGLLDQAIAACEEAVRLNQDSAGAHINLGIALQAGGKLDDAIACYNKAIQLDPKLVAAHYNVGRALRKKGVLDQAIASFKEAVRLKADYGCAYSNLGDALLNNGDVDEALAAAEQAVRFGPAEHADHHLTLGNALQAKGRLDEAIAAFAEAIRVKPNYADAHNNLAWLLAASAEANLRDIPRAVKLAKKAVELTPNKGEYWNTLGVAHYRAGDWKAAIEALERSTALRKGGDSFDWFFHAMAHWQLGEKEQAVHWRDKAVEWMEKHKPQNEELLRFRAEAEELLKEESGVRRQESEK